MSFRSVLSAVLVQIGQDIKDLRNNSSSAPAWHYYAINWSVKPTKIGQATSPVVGNVWQHTLNGTTRYRLIPTQYTPTEDTFYSDFSDGICSGKIVSRG